VTETVQVRRVLKAPVGAVWRAWTDPGIVARWSWGRQHDTLSVDIDCRPGGRWRQEIRDRKTGEKWTFDQFTGRRDGTTEVVITHTRLEPEKKKGTEIGWNGCLDAIAECLAADA
jgi:uncharacterized protein YndB with AHSA1/START domain